MIINTVLALSKTRTEVVITVLLMTANASVSILQSKIWELSTSGHKVQADAGTITSRNPEVDEK